MNHLTLKNIAVTLGSVHVLRGVELDVHGGEVLMLTGPNGAGKTTLLHVLLGLVNADQGQIDVDNRPLVSQSALRKEVGYLPEAVAFADNLSARGVLRFFATARGVSKKRVEEVLEQIGLLDAAKRAVSGYSRGMKQRLGLGVAILHEPNLLVLDEPTGGLDVEGLTLLFRVLKQWRDAGRIVLLSTHDFALLERRIDRMCVMQEGVIKATGTPDELRRNANLPTKLRFKLSENANGFVKAVQDYESAQVAIDGDEISVQLVAKNVLPFMQLCGEHPQAASDLRVEEAPLEEVYERILGVLS
ncbi:MAG: ABC transporter ATP-binding protein [Deltaproteobacteria bacterium]|nr:ABC transporter ATP-binding protein [Deltaproteobacteria bacterium]